VGREVSHLDDLPRSLVLGPRALRAGYRSVLSYLKNWRDRPRAIALEKLFMATPPGPTKQCIADS
jgi:hypothetical protein